MSDTDVFTVVSSLAWLVGLALGFAFGYFAGFSRGRGRRMAIRAARAARTARGGTPPVHAVSGDAARSTPGRYPNRVPDPPLAPHLASSAPPGSPPEWRGRLVVTGNQPTPESLSSRDTVPIPRLPRGGGIGVN